MIVARIREQNLLATITAGSWILLLLLSIAALMFASIRFAAGLFVGGLVAIGNFYWLRGTLRRLLRQEEPNRASRLARIRYLLRFAVLGITIYTLIVHVRIDPIGLLVGLSILVVTISALALYTLTSKGD